MIKKINTGGQAFPCLERGGNGLELTDGGMTLRDWFAGKAMQSMMRNWAGADDTMTDEVLAKVSYEVADAMLRAREAT